MESFHQTHGNVLVSTTSSHWIPFWNRNTEVMSFTAGIKSLLVFMVVTMNGISFFIGLHLYFFKEKTVGAVVLLTITFIVSYKLLSRLAVV